MVFTRKGAARVRVLSLSSLDTGRSVVLLAVLYSLMFTVLTSVLLHKHGFPLDDSYIHQTVARNLAEHGTLGFSTGRSSSGVTSVLWMLLQALRYKVAGSLDPSGIVSQSVIAYSRSSARSSFCWPGTMA